MTNDDRTDAQPDDPRTRAADLPQQVEAVPGDAPRDEQQAHHETAASQATPPKPPRRAFSRQGAWVAIVLTIVGALFTVGTLSQAIWNSAVSWPLAIAGDHSGQGGGSGWGGPFDEPSVQWEDTLSADELADVTAIDVQARSSELRIVEGSGTDSSLTVATTANRSSEWTFEIDGDTLVVHEERGEGGGWGRVRATLELPEDLLATAPALTVALQSGAIEAAGSYGEVTLAIASGAGEFVGAASHLDVSVASGAFDVEATVTDEAAFAVESGVLGVELTGEAPSSTSLDVNSGMADVTLPPVPYRVSGEVKSGERDITVPESATADATLEVNVSSGAAFVQSNDD